MGGEGVMWMGGGATWGCWMGDDAGCAACDMLRLLRLGYEEDESAVGLSWCGVGRGDCVRRCAVEMRVASDVILGDAWMDS